MIVRGKRCIARLLELLDARLDGRLVDADHIVVLVHVDVERPANRHHQMFFIQLGVALDRIVLDVFGDVAKFSECLVFQFMVCISHRLPHLNLSAWNGPLTRERSKAASILTKLSEKQNKRSPPSAATRESRSPVVDLRERK